MLTNWLYDQSSLAIIRSDQGGDLTNIRTLYGSHEIFVPLVEVALWLLGLVSGEAAAERGMSLQTRMIVSGVHHVNGDLIEVWTRNAVKTLKWLIQSILDQHLSYDINHVNIALTPHHIANGFMN